ncbi:hypothetical protein HO173_005744 [Letharia columbiana]|uniref:Uncharacterized protein n=1 Tax=Letharia columbiana TaxID=112416 RepID=A0A8H6FWK2_9LECA|nr:uncharacterized protein HO173_005744 [Letharia columbiana]KAF6236116.1 hypothetical protein HO173_005744 [Letharia columbiana]
MSIKVYSDYDDVCVREHEQVINVLRIPSDVHCKPPRVFEVGLQAKRRMVNPSTKIYAEGGRVMENALWKALKTVDRETSGQFGLRKLAVEKFTFKLPQAQLDVGTVSATIDDEACAVDYVYRAGRKVIVGGEDTGNFVESSVSGVPESAQESPPMESYALRAKTRLGGITPGPRGTMTRASRAK